MKGKETKRSKVKKVKMCQQDLFRNLSDDHEKHKYFTLIRENVIGVPHQMFYEKAL